MGFKEFLEQDQTAQDYFNSLIANLHLKNKYIKDFYKKNPSTLANFIDDNGKRKNALTAATMDLGDDFKQGTVTILTPKSDLPVAYTKDNKPIFNKKTNRKKYSADRQMGIDILTQPMASQASSSKLGGAIA
jgi:hypothetical protein